MTLSTDEQSWLAEVEERVNRALSTIQPEPFWNDFTRLLALVKRLAEDNRELTEIHESDTNDLLAALRARDTLRSQLEVAKKALVKISSAYYETSGGLSAWKRDVLEAAIESDTAIARAALAAIEGEGK